MTIPPTTRRSAPWQRPIPPPVRLVGGLALLVVAGTLILLLPGMGAERLLTLNEAFFTAVSALSVTGLSIIAPGRDLSLLGQLVLLVLIQLGGAGFMVVAVITFRFLGRRISLADKIALRDSLGLLDMAAIVQLTRRVVLVVFLIEGAGALALWVHWRPTLGEERALFYAVFHAVSAFCNAGFDLFNGLPEFPAGVPNDNLTLIILGTLIVLGGLGIPVIGELILWWRHRAFSLHTKITLTVSALLVMVGGAGLLLAESLPGGLLTEVAWDARVVQSVFQSLSARTAGFAGIARFDDLTAASQVILMTLMFIGSGPASMGGGITTGTFAVLVLLMWGYARGHAPAHVAGRSIGLETIRRAAAVLVVSLFVAGGATLLLLLTHPQASLDATMFEVVSAFATCGLSLNFTGQLNVFGQVLIAGVMFWGRLGALTIVLAVAQPQKKPLVTYPEEQILIG